MGLALIISVSLEVMKLCPGLVNTRDVPIWNFADNPITNCIKLSANTDTDTDIDAYVQSLSFHAR